MSCTSPGRVWRGGIWAGRADRGAVRGVPVRGPAGSGCTGPGTWCAGGRTGSWCSSGRADDQVKVRGFRVELGEIEAVLAAHPRVAQAAVTVAGGPAREPGGWSAMSSRRRRWRAGQRCAGVRGAAAAGATWCPPRWWCWSALPLTANGKLDRAALPAPEFRRPAAVSRGAADRARRRSCAGCSPKCWAWSGSAPDDEFLRAGRAFAAGHAADQPGPRRAGRRAPHPARCSTRHRRRAGGAVAERRGTGAVAAGAARRGPSGCRCRSGSSGCGS